MNSKEYAASHKSCSKIGVKTVAGLPLAETVPLRCRSQILLEADLTFAEMAAAVAIVAVAFVIAVGAGAVEGAGGAGHCG